MANLIKVSISQRTQRHAVTHLNMMFARIQCGIKSRRHQNKVIQPRCDNSQPEAGTAPVNWPGEKVG